MDRSVGDIRIKAVLYGIPRVSAGSTCGIVGSMLTLMCLMSRCSSRMKVGVVSMLITTTTRLASTHLVDTCFALTATGFSITTGVGVKSLNGL